MAEIREVLSLLQTITLPLDNEKEAQLSLTQKLKNANFNFDREYRLNDSSIPDFFIEGIVIELKIKGNARKIYRQCVRYCEFNEVKALILLTNRSMGFPNEINNKPCYIINIGKKWL